MTSQLSDYIDLINSEIIKNNGDITDTINQCLIAVLSSPNSTDDIEQSLMTLSRSCSSCFVNATIFFYSAAIYAKHSATTLTALLDYILLHQKDLLPDTLFYLFGQLSRLIFVYPELNTPDNFIKTWQLLDYSISRYETIFSDFLVPIPSNARNDNFVLVLTDQFLNFMHGPTKTAADRCKILSEYMKKNVLLVNTAEAMSTRGITPFFNAQHGNYNKDLLSIDHIEWKSCRIPYFQCEPLMPDNDIIKILLSMIHKQRPAYIISIGNGGIVAALASHIVPTLSIGLLPSGLSMTGIPFQTLSRPLNDADRHLLRAVGRSEHSVIIGTFGTSILEQTIWRTRESVNLPSEAWLAALVGGRLDQELNPAFWDMAEKAVSLGIEFVILGPFKQSNLEKAFALHPALTGKLHPMGLVEDVLSYLDLCDLYINPVRAGGGTSCVEAMSIGLPVITTAFGDVSVNVGEQFQTESYDTMLDLLSRYITDFDFYQSQCLAARKRAAILLNAEENFVQIVCDFLAQVN